MQMENQKLAPGLCFRPCEEELMRFLKEKAMGKKMSTTFVAEKNLYGEGQEPWNVLSDINKDLWTLYDESSRTKKAIYVVTKVSKNERNTTIRTTRVGTWDGQTKLYPVENKARTKIIGNYKMLSYAVDPDHECSAVGMPYWYLHEMKLSEESLIEIGLQSTDYVMCRIIRDTSKPCHVNGKKRGKKFKKTDQEIRARSCTTETLHASNLVQQHGDEDEFSFPQDQTYGGSNMPQETFNQGDHTVEGATSYEDRELEKSRQHALPKSIAPLDDSFQEFANMLSEDFDVAEMFKLLNG